MLAPAARKMVDSVAEKATDESKKRKAIDLSSEQPSKKVRVEEPSLDFLLSEPSALEKEIDSLEKNIARDTRKKQLLEQAKPIRDIYLQKENTENK